MPLGTIVLLGSFAGLTIYLGLPLAFFKNISQTLKAFLSMLATGVLIFLLYDVIDRASEPINTLLTDIHTHPTDVNELVFDIILMIGGLVLGLMSLVYFNTYVISRMRFGNKPSANTASTTTTIPTPQNVLVSIAAHEPKASRLHHPHRAQSSGTAPTTTSPISITPSSSKETSPQLLALIIAIGIGFHNFSEGLAIGQSAAIGALQLATVLIIGFGLHNMTEGFGIAGPLVGQRVSLKFIVLIGLIGGGPTFLGTVVGIVFHSTEVFIFCLALAAGAILYVVAELLGVAKRFKRQDIAMWGLLIGFLLGYATDLIVTYGGA